MVEVAFDGTEIEQLKLALRLLNAVTGKYKSQDCTSLGAYYKVRLASGCQCKMVVLEKKSFVTINLLDPRFGTVSNGRLSDREVETML